jgi:hypothetical protein
VAVMVKVVDGVRVVVIVVSDGGVGGGNGAWCW